MTYKNTYASFSKSSPDSLAVCDRSGFVFNRRDMDFQYEWAGDSLVNTGMLIAKIFLDKPQEQSRPPKIKDDPRPVKDPRPLDNIVPSPRVLPINELLAKLNNASWTGEVNNG